MAPVSRESLTMSDKLTNAQLRKLKGMAQRLDAQLKVGKQGLSEAFLKAVDEELTRHELVKIKFAEFKEEKKTLASQIAERTGAQLIMRVGNVAVFFRQNVGPERRKVQFQEKVA